MARPKKKNNIRGCVDGRTYYTMDGNDYIKNSSAPDRERLKTDPAYAPVRVNFNLFGSISTVVSVFRKALKSMFPGAMHTRIHGNLVSLFRSMTLNGQRSMINLRENKTLLRSYLFKPGVFFDVLAERIPYELMCTEDRRLMQLKLKCFKYRKLKQDGNRSHFRMTMGVLLFADCARAEGTDHVAYSPVSNPFHCKLYAAESMYIHIHKLEEEQMVSVTLPEEAQDEQLSMVVLLHLVFYEEVNGVMYSYGNEVMKVAEVF